MEDNSTPTPTPKENLSDEQKSVIKPIRTYERDVAEALRSSNASVVSINLQEHEVKAPPKIEPVDRIDILPQSPIQSAPKVPPSFVPPKPVPGVTSIPRQRFAGQVPTIELPPSEMDALRKPDEKHYVYVEKEEVAKKGILFLVSIVLIVATISLAGILYIVRLNQQPVTTVEQDLSLIGTEYKESGELGALSKNSIIAIVKEKISNTRPPSSITAVEFLDNKTKENISASTFVSTLAPVAPGNLVRAFGEEWLYGVYSNGGKNESLFIARISSFENAFDGMLAWEQNMANDLQDLFPQKIAVASTTPTPVLKHRFEDIIIKNKDARVLRNTFEDIELIYSFLDEKTLVIAWSRAGLEEVINRFLVSRNAR